MIFKDLDIIIIENETECIFIQEYLFRKDIVWWDDTRIKMHFEKDEFPIYFEINNRYSCQFFCYSDNIEELGYKHHDTDNAEELIDYSKVLREKKLGRILR